MPLDRQVITMPLAQGVDTKTDVKQVTAGKLLELENGVFTTLKAIRKRNGSVALGKNITNTGASFAVISSGKGLAVYNNELLLADGEELYSYDQAANGWTEKDAFESVYVTSAPVIRDSYDQACPDGVTHPNGLQAYVWEDSSGTNVIKYCIIDSATGQTVQPATQLATNAIKPRVISVNSFFLFYWYDTSTTQLNVAQMPVGLPNSTPTSSTLTGIAADANAINSTSPNYDVCVIDSQIGLAYNNRTATGATTIRMYYGNNPTTQSATQAVAPLRSRAITIFPAKTTSIGAIGVVVAFSNDNNVAPYTSDVTFVALTQQLSLVTFGTVESGIEVPRAITGVSAVDGSVGFQLYYSVFPASPTLVPKTTKAIVDSSFAVGLTSPWLQSGTLLGRAFAYDGHAYVPMTYWNTTTTQPTNFIVRDDLYIAAKALSGTSGGYSRTNSGSYGTLSRTILPGVSQISASAFRLACTEQALIAGSGIQTANNITALTFDFDSPQHSFGHATLGQNLHFTGGFVQMYDGVSVVEHNFHLYPDSIAPTASTSGGNMDPGVYTYAVTYEWIDNQGNPHISAPTVSSQVTVAGTGSASVSLVVPYLQFTAKTTNPVQIVFYRTQASGTVLYRISSLTTPSYNVINGVSPYLTYTDTLDDASIAENPQLYTQPLTQQDTIVENSPAPPTGLMVLHRNRIWVVDSTRPLDIWYSKEVFAGYPVEFNSGFIRHVDPRGGDITALATVDDKLLVFKQSHIFFIVGQGPTNADLNNDFSDAILITTDCGCIDPRSVVGTPVGIMFQSAKGIYLIDRSLQVQYVGSPVEAYNNETITSATLTSNTNQVRFTLESGKTLVFDYFVQQWGVFTNQYAVDSLNWQDTMVLLRSNGTVLKETPGVFTDAGSPIKLKLATSWLSFANVQGFQRVRRAQILGAYSSPHNLSVSVCVDFNDLVIQEATIVPTPPTYYGGSSPYGAESVYGGTFQLYQWRIDLARQKCQAVKFIIEELPEATAGEGFNLTSIGFEVGAKTGLNKMPASQIVS